MEITIDANIIFACLIKNSDTRKLFFNPRINLYAPAFMLIEIQKYLNLIKKKSKLNDSDFSNLLARILTQITIVNDDEIKPFLFAASSLTTDKKDWLYLACALYKNTYIWSNDKEFLNQTRIKIYTTTNLIEKLKGD